MNKRNKTILENTAYVESVGCMMRDLDADKIKSFLISNNYRIVDSFDDAYYKIIVTCGMNGSRIQESLKKIKESNPTRGISFITGCLPAIAPETLKDYTDQHIFPIKEVDKLYLYFKANSLLNNDIEDSNFFKQTKPKGRFEYDDIRSIFFQFELNKRFYYRLNRRLSILFKKIFYKSNDLGKASIRISNGCLLNCTFCGIKYAIGKLSSKSIDQIKNEYLNLITQGYRHIIFIGDDTGSYGLDLKETLPILLNELYKSTNIKAKWYFQDINPQWAIKYKQDLGKFVKNNCFNEMLFSIQSGSDNILKLMKRNYIADDVVENLFYYSKLNPKMRILGNFIVGFPGETTDDFEQTIAMCEKFKFEFIYVIPYFENPVSDSRHIEPKISTEIVEERLQIFEIFLKKQKTDYVVVR
jgi:tRNA A37 methylthiotransferase MiaB